MRIVRGAVVRDERTVTIEIELVPGRANRARVNRAPVPRPREVLGLLRTVLFAPEDLALVKGDPGGRRSFLDDLLVARAPRFAGVRADYDRVNKQRTTLLKSAGQARRGRGGSAVTCPRWTSGTTTWRASAASCWPAGCASSRRSPRSSTRPMSGSATAADRSRSNTARAFPTSAARAGSGGARGALRAELSGSGHRRSSAASRSPGPHRDDLVLSIGRLPARGYASQGESWSLALALRLASYEVLREGEHGGGEPVLLLDDVFAELDTSRRERLAKLLEPAEQVLITAAVADDVPPGLARSDSVGGFGHGLSEGAASDARRGWR